MDLLNMPCGLISCISSTSWGSQFTKAWFHSDLTYNQRQYLGVQCPDEDGFQVSLNEWTENIRNQHTWHVQQIPSAHMACLTDPISPHGMFNRSHQHTWHVWQIQSANLFSLSFRPSRMFPL
jgi:hypothetical protein